MEFHATGPKEENAKWSKCVGSCLSAEHSCERSAITREMQKLATCGNLTVTIEFIYTNGFGFGRVHSRVGNLTWH